MQELIEAFVASLPHPIDLNDPTIEATIATFIAEKSNTKLNPTIRNPENFEAHVDSIPGIRGKITPGKGYFQERLRKDKITLDKELAAAIARVIKQLQDHRVSEIHIAVRRGTMEDNPWVFGISTVWS